MTEDPLDRYEALITDELCAYQAQLDRGESVSAASTAIPSEVESVLNGLRRCLEFVKATRISLAETRQFPADSTPISNPPFGSYPSHIARFEVIRQLGVGGFGIVFLAYDPTVRREVAVKIPRPELLGSDTLIHQFSHEAAAAAKLDHPNILMVLESDCDGILPYIVAPYIPGKTLAQWRAGQTVVSPRMAAEIVRQLATGVAHAHERGVLHRDLKPGNVLLASRDGVALKDEPPFVPKITDFGLAKCATLDHHQTRTGTIMGSPNFMSPEQADGRHREVDVRSDVYSLGAILYQLISGRAPFIGTTVVDTLDQVRHFEPVRLHFLNPGTPRDLETICLKCLEKEPARRFDSARELVDELQRYLDGLPIHSRPIGPLMRSWRWCKRHQAAAGLIGLTLAAVTTIASIVTANNSAKQRDLASHNQDLRRLNDELRVSAETAIKMQKVAEESDQNSKELLYAADISRAGMAWRREDTRELRELLDRQIPKAGERDRRGFEWWYLHRQATLGKRVLLEGGSAIYMLRPSPDRRWLAAAGVGAIVRLFDPETGEPGKEFPTGQVEVNGIAFSPDQTELATAGDDGTLRVFNLGTGSERLKVATPFKKAYQVLYTSDGKRLICCGDHPVVYLYDAQTGAVDRTLEGHQSILDTIVLSEDGKTLVSAGNDESIRFWNLDDGTLQASVTAPMPIEPMIFLKSQGLLITGDSKGQLRSIDVGTDREISVIQDQDRIATMALHPDGSLLATGDASGRIRQRKIGLGGKLIKGDFHPWQAHRGSVYSLIWSKDGTRLISAGKDGRVLSWNHSVAQRTEPDRFKLEDSPGKWNFPQRPSLTAIEIDHSAPGPPRDINEWTLGRLVGRLVRLNLMTGTPGNFSSKSRYRFTHDMPDGKHLIAFESVNGEDVSHVFCIPNDLESPADRVEVLINNPQFIGFSPESKTLKLASVIEDNDASTGDILSIVEIPKSEPRSQFIFPKTKSLCFLPDERHVVLGTHQEIVLWDLERQKPIWRVPQKLVHILAYCPIRKLVAASTTNRRIIALDATSGRLVFESANLSAMVEKMTFSDDGRTLVTAAYDGTMKFLHVTTGQELLEFSNLGRLLTLEFIDPQHLFCTIRPAMPDARYDPAEIAIFDASEPVEK